MTIKIKPDPTLKNNLMAFGRECDHGWDRIIDELILELNELPDDIEVLQIKEKFGGLRFYVSGSSEKANRLISQYETYSYHICEVCGEFYTAKNRCKHGWWKTLCDKCAEELEKN
jgi:hypothetical protein